MGKRIVAIFSTILALLVLCACRVFVFALGDHTLAETAAQQQTYTLTIPSGRGNFYDRNGKSSDRRENDVYGGHRAGPASCSGLAARTFRRTYGAGTGTFGGRTALLAFLDEPVEAEGIVCVPQTERTSRPALAVHLLGYLDGGRQRRDGS